MSGLTEEVLSKWRSGRDSYGFAMILQPYVGKGDKSIDYKFGEALKRGSFYESKLFLKGLWWIENSKGINVHYPRGTEPFDRFCSTYIQIYDVSSSFFDYKGFRFMSSGNVLASSAEEWQKFKDEHLSDPDLKTSNIEMIDYDPVLIYHLITLNDIRVISSSRGRLNSVDFYNCKKGTFRSVTINRGDNDFKLVSTFKDDKFQPVIDLVERLLLTCGSSSSVVSSIRSLSRQA